MTSEQLITELNDSLGAVAQDRKEYLRGLNRLGKQFKTVKKDLLKSLKKETKKSRRKVLKRDLRRVEQACQLFQ
jgi:uncharacterized coiled-coil protein SlyX